MSAAPLPTRTRVGQPVGPFPQPAPRPRPTTSHMTGPRIPVVVVVAALGALMLASVGVLSAALSPVRQSLTEVSVAPPASSPAELTSVAREKPLPMPREVLIATVPEAVSEVEVPPAEPACDRFGTQIAFVRSPSVAFARARQTQKLVMVLHVAGNFEDPGFT
jgi:hypothetical protein